MWVPCSTHSSITKATPRIQVAGNELDITIARHALLHRFTFNQHTDHLQHRQNLQLFQGDKQLSNSRSIFRPAMVWNTRQ